ncbi:MAG: site-specific integrase [Fimbriimonadaceae bacterium]|nr:site-specific integrase [Fimbriimonadaceae bacterium]
MAAGGSRGRRANGDGWVYKDGNSYRVKVAAGVDPVSGKIRYRSARAKSHAEALDVLRRLQSEKLTGKLMPSANRTLGGYLEGWLERNVKPNRAPNTYRQYAWIVNSHVIPHLGKRDMDKVTRPDVQALLATKAKQKVQPRSGAGSPIDKTLSRSTMRLIRAILHAAYQDAIRDGLTARNPVQHVQLPPEARKPPAFLDPDQAAALMKAARDSDLADLFRFMLSTGTRIGEATGVRWQDLDLERGFVRISGQLQRIDGKLTYRPVTKTNQDRAIPISPTLVEAFRTLRIAQDVNDVRDADGIVFLNAEGRKLDPKFVSKRLAKVCQAAGVPVISPHKLRHTAATVALAETGDLHGVQKMLGHQQVALTANLYGHATAETIRSVTNSIEKSISSLTPISDP